MSIQEAFRKMFFLHFEWIALTTGLILMFLIDPASQAPTLCPLDRLGFEYCPGTGLGTSVAYAARGELVSSFESHPAGIPAIIIMVLRIGSIFHRNYQISKTEDL